MLHWVWCSRVGACLSRGRARLAMSIPELRRGGICTKGTVSATYLRLSSHHLLDVVP
jgi:hypothetical protein